VAVFASYPFLLDFSRNHLHVIDHYGGACPPPGLPLDNAQLLKKYLLAQDIHFIAYSYGDEASYGRARYASRLQSDGTPYGERLKKIAGNNFRFQDMLLALRKTEKVVFDNGALFVLQLTAG
jgi:hypothetical protein